MSDIARPPAWITKRDGRLVPFESDKISRALFAAAEEIGLADAFLARELADSVVFFLSTEHDGSTPTTAQIAELVVKVVRELGHPALAAAFAAAQSRKPRGPKPDRRELDPSREVVFRFNPTTPLADVLLECARQYGLSAVYSRDLAAVQDDGLMTLHGLESPLDLAACVWPTPEHGLAESVEQARQIAAGVVAIHGWEYAPTASSTHADPCRELGLALRATGLTAVVNLNSDEPPSWAGDLATGPLFEGPREPPSRASRVALADSLAERILAWSPLRGRVRIDWHVGERDSQPAERERLVRRVEGALAGADVAFAFDRPRRPVPLAEGLDRQHTAIVLRADLNLVRLLDATRGGDPELFLHKLGSLARLALSAAVQKREFLRRRRPELNRGFRLERARLVVTPCGLDHVVRRVLGVETEGAAALDFARRIVQRLAQVLRQDGEACRLQTCLDGDIAALSEGPLKNQLRQAGALHAASEGGTAVVQLDGSISATELADILAWAWQRTDVVRLRFDSAGGSVSSMRR